MSTVTNLPEPVIKPDEHPNWPGESESVRAACDAKQREGKQK